MSDMLSIMFSLSLILIRMKRFSLSGCFVCPEMRLEQHAGVLAFLLHFLLSVKERHLSTRYNGVCILWLTHQRNPSCTKGSTQALTLSPYSCRAKLLVLLSQNVTMPVAVTQTEDLQV